MMCSDEIENQEPRVGQVASLTFSETNGDGGYPAIAVRARRLWPGARPRRTGKGERVAAGLPALCTQIPPH